jgi:hypothetical protein
VKRKVGFSISVMILVLAIVASALFYAREARKSRKLRAEIETLEMSLP